MKTKIAEIVSDLNSSIQIKELELSDVIQDVPSIIGMMETVFEELKMIVSEYNFLNDNEEIYFFKEIKPKLFSKLIYFRKIYYLELNRPVADFNRIRKYLHKEQYRIHFFSERNADFIQYYRSGKTTLDKFYFLRNRREFELNLECFYFERDPKFSTNFDFKVAKLLANDMLAAYLNAELAKLTNDENNIGAICSSKSNEKWTDTKAALTEIIYGIHLLCSINAGNTDIKILASIFSKIFNIDLSDIYHTFLQIRNRKGDRTIYLNRMIKALNQRMDELDN